MDASLMSLPSEIIAAILTNLPLHTLLAFSATCRINRVLAHTALQELHLAVFSRTMHGRLALLEHNEDSTPSNFSVIKTTRLEKSPLQTARPSDALRLQVLSQNNIATNVLKNKLTHNLRSLSLHMYDFDSGELASVMATNLYKLRELDMRFRHPYVHDRSLSASHWKEAPDGKPCWNALVGLGVENQKKLRLRGLHSLQIERAGLTSVQLRTFVESNPRLKKLHLDNVAGVDQQFVQWLGTYCDSGESRLEEITLQGCPELKMQRLEDFAWLVGITASSVRHLSFSRCRNVRHEMLVHLIDNVDEDEELELNMLETIIPPRGPPRHFGIAEEVVPGPLTTVVAVGIREIAKLLSETDKIDVDPQYAARAVMAAA